jgi:hypothetical protein
MHLLLLLLTGCQPDPKPDTAPSDEDADGFAADVDCDDQDPDIHPGATEVCDLHDQDCDGEVDEGVLLTFWFDDDADGYGEPGDSVIGCQAPGGTVENEQDCDDADEAIHPGAEERCNGVDDDCDGAVEPSWGMWYPDADGDGYGDSSAGVETCTPETGWILEGTDCDDADAAVNPGAEEQCDRDDDNCDGRADLGEVQVWHTDTDGDGYGHMYNTLETCDPPEGYVLDGTDCRPGDPEAFPGAPERCNDDDDDCDMEVDEDFELDGDGVLSEACGGTDCDDTDASVLPGGEEICEDGKDNDCSGGDAHCGFGGTFDLGSAGAKAYSGEPNYDAARLIVVDDLDGDGINDVTIPVMYADGYNGGAYVLPGPLTGTGTLDDMGWRIEGSRATYAAGRSIGVGDVDGDGVNDLAIGAPDGTDKEWILLGPIDSDKTITDAEISYTGRANSEVGHGSYLADVNGDGIDDAVIGAYEDTAGGYASGTVYIDYGPIATGSYDLRTESDAYLIGEAVSAYAGRYVRAGGDVDGDGVGDILLVAPYASHSGPYSGTAYLVYGGVTGDFDLASADGLMHGESASDYAGEELTMGDVDGDGLDDVILGSYDTAHATAGAAYVVLGPASGTTDLGSADIIVRGDDAQQQVGMGLAVGDIDGDGAGELLVGGIGDRDGGRSAGAAWLWFGPLSGTLTLSDADAKFVGENAGDQAGEAVDIADVDGDGALEVLIGAPAESTGGAAGGAVYVTYAVE